MSERNEKDPARPATERDAAERGPSGGAPREQDDGPEKRHGDGLLEGNGSRHGADAQRDD